MPVLHWCSHPNSHFHIFSFYLNILVLLLSFVAFLLCFQGIHFSPHYSPSSHPARIALLILSGLGSAHPPTAPHPSSYLPSSYFTRPGMELLLLSREMWGGWVGEARASDGLCLGRSCKERSCLSLAVCLSLHIQCVEAGAMLHCVVLSFCFVLSMVAVFGPGYAGVGSDVPLLYPHGWAGSPCEPWSLNQ